MAEKRNYTRSGGDRAQDLRSALRRKIHLLGKQRRSTHTAILGDSASQSPCHLRHPLSHLRNKAATERIQTMSRMSTQTRRQITSQGTTRGKTPRTAQTAPLRDRATAGHPNLVLAICCMSLLLTGMDVTIVNVALPAIQRDLHSTISGLQWLLDSYTLVVASLLMFCGSMSDRFGRRRVFQIGLGVFTLGSVLCSVAPNVHGLIGFRALQGLGASMLNRSRCRSLQTLSRKQRSVHAPWASGVPWAVCRLPWGRCWVGFLTQISGWRAVFWINLPIGIAAALLAARYVPESKAPRARALDPAGQLLVFTALGTLTYTIIEGPHAGWHAPRIALLFAAAALAFALLLWYEPRRAEPLLDLRFFRSVPFSSATVIALCSFSSFAAFLFLNALYLQQVRGFSALHAGLSTLPLALMMIVCAPLSGRMVGRFGPRPSLLVAGIALLLSALLLTRLTAQTPLGLLYGSYVLFGIGLGLVNPAISNAAVSGMPRSQAGVAAAIASTGRQVGAALGVATAGTVVAAAMRTIWRSRKQLIRSGGLSLVAPRWLSWWGAFPTPRGHGQARRRVAYLLDPAK